MFVCYVVRFLKCGVGVCVCVGDGCCDGVGDIWCGVCGGIGGDECGGEGGGGVKCGEEDEVGCVGGIEKCVFFVGIVVFGGGCGGVGEGGFEGGDCCVFME